MFLPTRRSLGIALGVLALWGPLSQKVPAQFRPPTGVPPLNPYVNPLAASMFFPTATLGRSLQGPFGSPFPHNAAVLQTQAMLHSPAASGAPVGLGMYGPGLGYGGLGLGYASLLNGGVGGYGGYGLLGTALTGAALGYGYGMGMYGTQWMINPYQGYLQGAASLTRANAEYQKTIQQAKLIRQEARRSALETRRAMIEEAEWERAHMPDPEKIRQQTLERELDHARHEPPRTEIWSARTLNALLRHLIAQQREGARGPKVPLNEAIVKHINFTAGDTRGNVGLLKDNANLEWPEPLQRSEFQGARRHLNSLMKEAYKSVTSGNNPRAATLNDLQDAFGKMQEILYANVERFTADDCIEANRYLGQVKDTLTALKDPKVINQFNTNWTFKGNDVADLVRHMREKGLLFAAAMPKDEAAYIALYRALGFFDAGMSHVVSSRGNSENGNNK